VDGRTYGGLVHQNIIGERTNGEIVHANGYPVRANATTVCANGARVRANDHRPTRRTLVLAYRNPTMSAPG
jgi:hypothetical protein